MVQGRVIRGRRPGGRAKYIPKRRVCFFCRDKVEDIDFKNPVLLRPYISDRGKIMPRRKSGACAKHQRRLSMAIKRARFLALLPYVPAHIRKTGGIGLKS
jgi:small subunit ribosomal protein S18